MKKKIKAYRKRHLHCERCFQEYSLLVHHKDRNRQNNEDSNLEVLCMSCHAIEHERFKNITWVRQRYYEVHPAQYLLPL